MPSSYSPKLRFELIGAGEQAGLWGTTTNKNLGDLVEQAVAGVTNLLLDGLSGDYVLVALDGVEDEARSAVVVCTQSAVPAAGPINLIIPTSSKLYLIRNQCGQTVRVKTAAQTGTADILNGEATLIFCDGENAYYGVQTAAVGTLTVSGGGTGVTSFAPGVIQSPGGTAALTSGAIDINTETTGQLPVPKGGTGLATVTSGALLLGNNTGALNPLVGTTNGQLATWNSSTSTWTAAAPPAAGVTSFNTRTGVVTPQSGDYSSFYPTVTGSGASGTWAINITGNAGSATTATNASFINNSGSNGFGARTISTSTPSGGSNGDIWYQV
jgi:hypothetical protein